VNFRYKHVRPSQDNPQGGRIMVESPIHASNVRVYCARCERGTGVVTKRDDGKKVRACKRCGEPLGND
jgi:large subunit ribosomal protein L24